MKINIVDVVGTHFTQPEYHKQRIIEINKRIKELEKMRVEKWN